MRRRRISVGILCSGFAVIAGAVALAGCGQAATPITTTSQTTPSGPVGSTLPVSDSSGTKLDVVVEKVIDPATGVDAYSTPAAGKRFVAVKLRVRNVAARSYQNNANNETTIILANGHTAVADYNPISGCGNFSNGQITLASGASATGCVTFQIPSPQKVAKVRYGNTVFPGTTAEWHGS
jgi:hypothetical protein